MELIKEKVYSLTHLETNLICLEDIIAKYINYPEGAVYHYGARLPVESRGELGRKARTSSIPFHPIVGAELFKQIAENELIQCNTNKLLLEKNPLMREGTTGNKLFDSRDIELEEIVEGLVPGINSKDLNSVLGLCSTMMRNVIGMLGDLQDDRVRYLDVTSPTVYLIECESITSYRYRELLEDINEINSDIEETGSYVINQKDVNIDLIVNRHIESIEVVENITATKGFEVSSNRRLFKKYK